MSYALFSGLAQCAACLIITSAAVYYWFRSL
jgi:hypothetical protein